MAGSSPSLPDGSNPSAAIVQSASDVQCSRLLKTTVIQVRMSESHHVEVVAIDCLQFVLETGLQVDFRGVGIFGSIALAKVEENSAAARQDNLGGVPVSDRVKDNLMHVCHGVLLVQDKWQLCY